MDYTRYASEHHLQVRIDDRVAIVTLDRPEVHNAVNHALHVGLETVFRELAHDRDVGAIVLTGSGKSFCAGGDVKGYGNEDDRPIDQLRGTRYLVQEMINCEAPIIAAVNGTAAGLGATIALLSDVIYMADTARIGDTHVKIGIGCRRRRRRDLATVNWAASRQRAAHVRHIGSRPEGGRDGPDQSLRGGGPGCRRSTGFRAGVGQRADRRHPLDQNGDQPGHTAGD